MALPDGIIDEFKLITNYDLSLYFSVFVSFIDDGGRLAILDYYSGRVSAPDTDAFDTLRRLKVESEVLYGVIEGNKDRFGTAAFWELQEVIEDVATAIETIDNSSKWLRSAIEKGNFNPRVDIEKILRQYQTIEGMARETGYDNPDSDWVNIAIKNDVREEDYTVLGGTILKVAGSNKFAIQLRTVVDNISGKKVYGIDIDRTITFSEDDLKALGYDETMIQTVEVLAEMKKGDNPEFPEDGIQASLVAGGSRSSIPYPALIRQFVNTFGKDDTLQSFRITNISTVQDALNISFEVETKLREVLEQNIQI